MGWVVAGLFEKITNSAKLKLELELSLAKVCASLTVSEKNEAPDQ